MSFLLFWIHESTLTNNQYQYPRGTEVIEFTIINELKVLNNTESIPTFNSSIGSSWIDIVLSRDDEEFDIAVEVIDQVSASDHNLLAITIKKYQAIIEIPKINYHRLAYGPFDAEVIKFLNELNFPDHYTIDDKILRIQNGICSLAVKFTKPKKQKQRTNAPWWTHELRTQRSKVRALRRRYTLEKDPVLRKSKVEVYNKEHADYKRNINRAKRVQFNNFIRSTFDNVPYYKAADFVKNKRRHCLHAVLKDGILTTNREETIRTIIDAHFPKNPDEAEFSPVIGPVNEVQLTNQYEVQELLKKMKNNRAPGVDGLQKELIERAFKRTPEVIIEILNDCMKNGYFPACWKVAKIPKPNKDLKNVDAYRPISLLPAWGKLLDKLITTRLDYYLEEEGY